MNLNYGNFEIFRKVYSEKRCFVFLVLYLHGPKKMSTPSKVPNYGNYGGVLVMK